MSARLPAAAAFLAAALCLAGPASGAADPRVHAEPYVTGLHFPVSLDLAADGTVLVTEKEGAVRLVEDGVLAPEPVAKFSPYTSNEAGLLGLALAPDFETSRVFLVLYTPASDFDHIRIARLRLEADGKGTVLADPWLELPSRRTDRHYSGNLQFSPDGKLFVTLGDLRQEQNAQDPNPPGSVLRFEADGSIPPDNPFGPASPVYAMGVRNSFDLTIAKDGRIFASEDGGDVNDEMNAVERGKNYGWPLVQGYCDHFPTHEPCAEPPAYVEPAFEFRQVIGAAGIAIYEAELFADLGQDVLLAGYHSKRVHRLHFSAERGRFVELAPVFELDTSAPGYFGGGMVDVRVAPDGSILALASGLEVGTIFRLTPAAAPAALEGQWAPKPPAPSVRASGGCHASAAPFGSASPGWAVAALLALAGARRPPRRRLGSSRPS